MQSVALWKEDGSQGRTNQTADSNYILPRSPRHQWVFRVQKKMLLLRPDSPVLFVKLSCVLVLDSLQMSQRKSCTALLSLQQNVRALRQAPPCTADLFSSSVGLAEIVTLYCICRGEVKGISYQSRFEVILSLCVFLASTCATLPSFRLNCSFLIITSLTSSFSSSRSLFSLMLSIPLSLMLTL